MAYVLVTSPCYACKIPFAYNPNKVPSLTIAGERQPFCRSCIDKANPLRIQNGLPPIIPAPDAYEAVDESEVQFG